jgi:hypothetical protein
MGEAVTWATISALVEEPPSISILHVVKAVPPVLLVVQVILPFSNRKKIAIKMNLS